MIVKIYTNEMSNAKYGMNNAIEPVLSDWVSLLNVYKDLTIYIIKSLKIQE